MRIPHFLLVCRLVDAAIEPWWILRTVHKSSIIMICKKKFYSDLLAELDFDSEKNKKQR